MTTLATPRATLADLARVSEKAELIGGRIEYLMPTGFRPNRVAFHIVRSLDDFAAASGNGYALTDNVGYAVPELSSGRESFSPDASYFLGPPPDNEMSFVEGAPVFAVEVRSESDETPAAQKRIAAKRADYFEAGTLVVWDVDPVANVIISYRAESPEQPIVFSAGQMAHAEPAISGWSIPVDAVFRP